MPTPGTRRSLIGQGGPWSQVRRDLNRLFGTDSSSGTIPLSDPTNANDGNPATGATRTGTSASLAQIRQFAWGEGSAGGTGPITFPLGQPLVGSLLVVLSARADPSSGSVTPAVYTSRAAVTVLSGARSLYYGTRTATGTESGNGFNAQDAMVGIWEITGAASPAGFQVLSATEQAAAFTKSLGAFSSPGDLRLDAFITISDHQLFTIGSGWTQDRQAGQRGAIVWTGGHDQQAAVDVPLITGNSDTAGNWAGIAVGVTTDVPVAYDSRLVADLGIPRFANRMTLLSADAATQYEIAWSSDGSTWHVITPRTFAPGAPQIYDFDDLIARYWSIRDSAAGGYVTPLAWSTWTVEGFAF